MIVPIIRLIKGSAGFFIPFAIGISYHLSQNAYFDRMEQRSKLRDFLLLLSFLEGGAVMAVELLGAKMLAPYFGTSMPVWAAALGLTLGGLTAGYFSGGRLSLRFGKDPTGLFVILSIAGILIAVMPASGAWIMQHTVSWDLRIGAILSLLLFMVPPLVLLGTVSPVIIELITTDTSQAGNAAGTVYAISTLGGILATFVCGFWFIPAFGIRLPSLVFGALVLLPSVAALWRHGSFRILGTTLIIVAGSMALSGWKAQDGALLYHEEGILGQIKVADFEQDGELYRGLFVNGTLQTVQCLSDPEKVYWPYTGLIKDLTENLPGNGNALLLGMAGGTLVPMLHENGFELDVVDIDVRMETLAKTFFNIPLATPMIIDDARHFLNTTNKRYDLIIFDTFLGESVPEHLVTRESLRRLSAIVREKGFLIINFYGFEEGPPGRIAHALFQTLETEGWHTAVFATPQNQRSGNLEFVATRNTQALSQWMDRLILAHPELASSDRLYLFQEYEKLPEQELLSDELPQSLWYATAARAWRELYRKRHTEFSRLLH